MSKIIILRGNSGSGKSSVARKIQNYITPHPLLIEHDHFRRIIIKESEGPESINAELIYRTVVYALENDRDIIIEGIMRVQYYKDLFDKLLHLNPDETFFYYLDVSFDETLNRHTTKNNVTFGETEMRQWFKENDQTGYANEVIIPETNSLDDTVAQIILETNLVRSSLS